MTDAAQTRTTARQVFVKCDALRALSQYDGHPGAVADDILGELRAKGYVIVHPEDVPEEMPDDVRPSLNFASRWADVGWNACRASIFGDA